MVLWTCLCLPELLHVWQVCFIFLCVFRFTGCMQDHSRNWWETLYTWSGQPGSQCASPGYHWWTWRCRKFPLGKWRYSQTSVTRTSLGPWKFVRDMGSSSHWGLIMAPVQEANTDNLGKCFQFSTQRLYVECTH